jgi:diadenosine tetraphosphate (Ap4A) HIT family hydrolase
MALIYETKNFIVESHEKPEIDRLEGGHIKISPKIPVLDRTKLSPSQAIELIRLTIIAGEAMVAAMSKAGVEIGRINYQDNGNWTPELHIHLYCRAKNARMQKYGSPIMPGHKSEYQSLNQQDISLIREEIERLFKEEKYQDKNWHISF